MAHRLYNQLNEYVKCDNSALMCNLIITPSTYTAFICIKMYTYRSKLLWKGKSLKVSTICAFYTAGRFIYFRVLYIQIYYLKCIYI